MILIHRCRLTERNGKSRALSNHFNYFRDVHIHWGLNSINFEKENTMSRASFTLIVRSYSTIHTQQIIYCITILWLNFLHILKPKKIHSKRLAIFKRFQATAFNWLNIASFFEIKWQVNTKSYVIDSLEMPFKSNMQTSICAWAVTITTGIDWIRRNDFETWMKETRDFYT